jgi:carbamoyl-phosphate synthase large subunit
VTHHIPTITTLSAARAAAEGIAARQRGQISVRALQQLHAERLVLLEKEVTAETQRAPRKRFH